MDVRGPNKGLPKMEKGGLSGSGLLVVTSGGPGNPGGSLGATLGGGGPISLIASRTASLAEDVSLALGAGGAMLMPEG